MSSHKRKPEQELNRPNIKKKKQKPFDFLNINDDCLLEILAYLKLHDLRSVAGTSKRLKEIAIRVFAMKGGEVSMNVNKMTDTAVTIDYIRKFGPNIKTLRLKCTQQLRAKSYNIIFNMMVRYCGAGALTCLEMHGFGFVNDAIQEAKSVFAGVKQLILNGCNITVKWITMCPELTELVLFDTLVVHNGLLNQACSKLEVLKIEGSRRWVTRGLNQFLQQNGQIKTFEAVPIRNERGNRYEEILDFVPPSIECLRTTPLGLSKLPRFSSLKTVRVADIHKGRAQALVGLPEHTVLEYFEVSSTGEITIETNEISKLQNLKTLKLHSRAIIRSVNLIQIVRNLENLVELVLNTYYNYLFGSDLKEMIQYGQNLERIWLSFHFTSFNIPGRFYLNQEIYDQMLDTVLRRSNGKSLHIIIFSWRYEIKKFNLTFPMHPLLKITCLTFETISKTLNMEIDLFRPAIKMTEDKIKKLHDRGLCPKMNF